MLLAGVSAGCVCVCSSSSGTISEMAEGGLEIRCCEISMMMLKMMISMVDELAKYSAVNGPYTW